MLVKVVCVLEVKPSFPFVAVSDDDDPLLIVAGVIIIVMGFSTGGRNVEDCLLSKNDFVLLNLFPSNTKYRGSPLSTNFGTWEKWYY